MMKEVNLNIPDGISLTRLADVLRKRTGRETRAEKMLRNSAGATIWDQGKRVIENGKVLDVKWLKEKLAQMRGNPSPSPSF